MTVWGNGTKTRPNISSPYGPRSGGAFSFHYGCDFTGYSFIHATASGRVTFAGWLNNNAGNAVMYDIEERGPRGEIITLVHMHMASVGVSKGQWVDEASRVGVMGSTGNADGNCDHIEVQYWLNGNVTYADPASWLAARMGGAPAGGTGDIYGATWTKAAQVFLASLGLYSDEIDGIDGPNTQAGTRTFQGWVGLDQDGVFGPDTNKAAGIIKAGGNFTDRPVTEIQTFLQSKGLYGAGIDGIWGNQTSMGTYRFQAANGLSADAQWGQYTDAKAFPVVTPPPVVPGPVGRNITTRPTSEIQKLLKDKGLYTGEIDGDYGPGTTAAVVKLQQAGSLEADGIWGANTDVYGFFRPPTFAVEKQGVTVNAGTAVNGRVIRGVNFHHFGSTSDDRAYFAGGVANGRKSVPTLALLTNGEFFGYVPPRLQPWSTSTFDKDRISVEMQNLTKESDWQISGEQVESLIKLLVELRIATIKGVQIDGTPVNVELTRTSIQGHQEMLPGTVCPGPYVMAHLNEWVLEAQRRVDALTPPVDPEPTPTDYIVSKALGDEIRTLVGQAFPSA